MATFNDINCQICDRFISKEQWNKHLYSNRHLHSEVNGFWPAFFSQRKLTRDESMKLEKVFWEMIFVTEDYIEVYDFLKLFFRMCTNINNYVPVRPWFNDEDEDEQWGCGYRDDVIAQFKKDLYKINFTLQDPGKDDEIDFLENGIKLWSNIISNAQGLVPDNLYDFEYNNEGLDNSVCGAQIFPEFGEIKNLLDILRCKLLRRQLNYS